MADVRVQFEGLPEFRRALKKYAPEVSKEMNGRFRLIAGEIAIVAKAFAGWSDRIPRAIAPTVTSRFIGVRVSKKRAPHGGLYERGNKGSRSATFRHPVFGNRGIWRTEPVRPFLAPAVEAMRPKAIPAAFAAIEEARRKVGLGS